jgi:hypothetical protein
MYNCDRMSNRFSSISTKITQTAGEEEIQASDVQVSHLIPYNETLRMLTLPMVRKAKVNPSRGVKVLGGFYLSEAFRSLALERAVVSIRYDPTDTNHVFVFAKGQWLKCKRVRWIPVLD